VVKLIVMSPSEPSMFVMDAPPAAFQPPSEQTDVEMVNYWKDAVTELAALGLCAFRVPPARTYTRPHLCST
jgi:hypothetical protein